MKIPLSAIYFVLTFVFINFSFCQNKVTIGNQTWMTENLNVATFRNGDQIPEAKSYEEWRKAGEEGKPAWCYFENNEKNGQKSGKLYNWYAIMDSRNICPEGWRVPTVIDFEILVKQYDINLSFEKEFVKSNTVATFLKSKNGWHNDNGVNNYNGTNESGFTFLPGGRRTLYSFDQAYSGYLWTSNEHFYTNVMTGKKESKQAYTISFEEKNLIKEYNDKLAGYSLRCIFDTPAAMNNSSTSVVTSTNSTSNQESESKTIGKNETSIISFEEFNTTASSIKDVNERLAYRVEIMNLARSTDINILPRHITSYCYDLYESFINGSHDQIQTKYFEKGKTLTETICESVIKDGLSKERDREIFQFNSLIYLFCNVKLGGKEDSYNMTIVNGILNNYTAESYPGVYDILKNSNLNNSPSTIITKDKSTSTKESETTSKNGISINSEPIKAKINEIFKDRYNMMYVNGRKFSQSEYQQDYKCAYCPDYKIIGGWRNGFDETREERGPYYDYEQQEKIYTPQYLRKKYPYCSPKCAKKDND